MERVSRWRLHSLLLLGWIGLGTVLRLMNLTLKPLWTDEFATLVFSLGQSFRTIPLNQVISADVLMQPLQPQPSAGIGAVIHYLTTESNHPPLYFLLTHFWLQLFPIGQGETLAWAARSLSVGFGVLAIPAIFGLGWLAFGSRLVGQLAAALMAVSPFGIYLAQEARHYTLAVVWEIASLSFLMVAVRLLRQRRPLPWSLVPGWIAVNGLGIASHYFFALALAAEGLVLLLLGLARKNGPGLLQPCWWRIYAVAAGTLATGLIWAPFWNNTVGSELTAWASYGDRAGLDWLAPLYPPLAWILTMVTMLPIQANSRIVVVVSVAAMVAVALGLIPIVIRGLKTAKRLPVWTLAGFVIAALIVLLALSYGLHLDLTNVPRYSFIYFPGVIVVLAAVLAEHWRQGRQGKLIVAVIGLIGLLGAMVVNSNLGYHKVHQPDRLAGTIQALSQQPTLIAIVHETHGQTGRLMGLAWEFIRRYPLSNDVRFLLVHSPPGDQPLVLQTALQQMPQPLDLWLINFTSVELKHCPTATQPGGQGAIDGYDYQLYRCTP